MSIPTPQNTDNFPTVYTFDTMNGMLLNSMLPLWHPDLIETSETKDGSGNVIQSVEKYQLADGRVQVWTYNSAVDGNKITHAKPVVTYES